MEEQRKNGKYIILIVAIVALVVIVVLGQTIIMARINKNQEASRIEEQQLRDGEAELQKEEDALSEILRDGGNLEFDPGKFVAKKPIIYIYPEEEMEVKVLVGKPENLTHTYPKYEDGWKVKAKPNGDLVDIKTGRTLYALYWEGKNTIAPTLEEGFVVKGEDTIKFLEEKLEILGLNEREANEFIIYWLPKLESNKYNYIRFQTKDQIDENMPLQITPEPDNCIRVMMEYKGLEEMINIKEQKLGHAPARSGYTVVEWGGTEI